MTGRTAVRVALTVLWLGSLSLFFQWSGLTRRFAGVPVWTGLYLALFAITVVIHTRDLPADARRASWRAVAVWGSLGLGIGVAGWLMPLVTIGATPVPSHVFVTAADIVVALWIVARGVAVLWEPRIRVVLLASMFPLLLAYMWLAMVRMPGRSYSGAQPPLTPAERAVQEELERHVRYLAGEIGERSDITPGAVVRAAEYLERELRDAGYEVVSQAFEIRGRSYRNLEATLRGRERPDEIVVVGGHYDSVADAPGANDNASGTAGVLALARAFAGRPCARTVRWVLFANEEPPFFDTDEMGSRVYAARAAAAGDRIVAMISLETIGYYSDESGSQRYPFPFSLFYPDRGDFVGFVSDLQSGALVRRSLAAFRDSVAFPSQAVAAPAWIPGVFWSDHASFWIYGFRAIMITDTAFFRYPNYHTPEDTPDKLDYGRMARVVAGVAHVVRALAE